MLPQEAGLDLIQACARHTPNGFSVEPVVRRLRRNIWRLQASSRPLLFDLKAICKSNSRMFRKRPILEQEGFLFCAAKPTSASARHWVGVERKATRLLSCLPPQAPKGIPLLIAMLHSNHASHARSGSGPNVPIREPSATSANAPVFHQLVRLHLYGVLEIASRRRLPAPALQACSSSAGTPTKQPDLGDEFAPLGCPTHSPLRSHPSLRGPSPILRPNFRHARVAAAVRAAGSTLAWFVVVGLGHSQPNAPHATH